MNHASLFACVLALAPVAPARAIPAPVQAPAEAPAARILIQALGDPRADLGVVRRDLAALGAAALPELVDIAAHGRARIEIGREKRFEIALREDLCEVVVETLAGFPRESLLPQLEVVGAARTPETCTAALRVLAIAGDQRDLALMARLAEVDGEPPMSTPQQRQAFESAMSAVLQRVPASRALLRQTYASASPALAFSIVRATRGGPSEVELESLTQLLGWRPADDSLLLNEIARAARSIDLPAPEPLRALVRAQLASTSVDALRAAAAACAELEDDGSVGALIPLLEHAEPALARVARQALHRITRKDLGASAATWQDWHASELTWWSERSEACAEELALGDAREVAAAVLEIARCRLYRGEVARILGGGLKREEPQIVHLCCQALGQLRSECAVPHLQSVLGHTDATVRDSARMAMQMVREGQRKPAKPGAAAKAPQVPERRG